ncbi:MAG TPA: nuclear transport factor 2 family protein [Sphingomonadaceae bacterium]|nr:nuclear transport factor 2 family protein [Sphingomonadaceae bacterium]
MTSYAEDRAAIEDLQARYMFALDWQDPDQYAATFTEDAVLDWAGGVVSGREAIREECVGMRAYFLQLAEAHAPKRRPRLRHFITNVTVKVEGDRAFGRAYWFEIDNDTRNRWPYVGGYGHYSDELRKVEGEWLFSRRRIWNECMDDRPAADINPVTEIA